jgi:D-alanine-D-alanine ligase
VSLPRVLILSNEPVLPLDHPDRLSEIDVIETVDEVQKVLPPELYVTERLAYARDPRRLLTKLAEWKPDVIFNLFEGEADRTETEIYNAAILEWSGVPFTGAGSYAQALGRDKIRTKYLLHGAGVPTPQFRMIEQWPAGDWPFGWPAIVKPAYQDASVGIDQTSVVRTPAELESRVRLVLDRFGGPALVEQFIAGRELHIHLMEAGGRLLVMPAAEVVFEPSSTGESYWPIYSYAAKWDESSDEFRTSRLVSPVELASPLNEHVAAVCSSAYRLVGLRDYGRVDLRVSNDGVPFVIEVNPNPHINSLIFVIALKAMGRDYASFIRGLVDLALARRTNA